MDDDDYAVVRRRGGPGLGTVIVVSALTSVGATVGTVVAMAKLHLSVAAPVGVAPANVAQAGGDAHGAAATAGASDDVPLPDLTRVPVDSARSVLDALHLRLSVRRMRADPAIPVDAVAEQSPSPGTRARRGDIIEVVVSTGPAVDAQALAQGATDASADVVELVEVPLLVGRRIGQVRPMLDQAGLQLGRRRETFDEDRGPYVVLRQSVDAGTRVARGTAIDLVVNQGE